MTTCDEPHRHVCVRNKILNLNPTFQARPQAVVSWDEVMKKKKDDLRAPPMRHRDVVVGECFDLRTFTEDETQDVVDDLVCMGIAVVIAIAVVKVRRGLPQQTPCLPIGKARNEFLRMRR